MKFPQIAADVEFLRRKDCTFPPRSVFRSKQFVCVPGWSNGRHQTDNGPTYHRLNQGLSRGGGGVEVDTSASKRSIQRFVVTEKAPTSAFSLMKAATTAFTCKTLLRHYAKRVFTPQSLNVKLGSRHNYHKGQAAIRHYANQPARPL